MTRLILHTARILSLVLLASIGTAALMRFAPGYFTDTHEVDPQYAESARTRLKAEQDQQRNLIQLTGNLVHGWLQGDLGRSRQYDVPVAQLVLPRIKVSLRLLLSGVAGGWFAALLFAIPLATRRGDRGEALITAGTVILLAVPLGVLATICLVTDCGGPIAVLMAIIAVRDFKLIYRLIRRSNLSPHLVYARAQGLSEYRMLRAHLLPALLHELLAIAVVSIVTALSAIVPVEVIFDIPGLGQLAWGAAMNRDLPLLLGVTLVMAFAVGLLTIPSESPRQEVTV